MAVKMAVSMAVRSLTAIIRSSLISSSRAGLGRGPPTNIKGTAVTRPQYAGDSLPSRVSRGGVSLLVAQTFLLWKPRRPLMSRS